MSGPVLGAGDRVVSKVDRSLPSSSCPHSNRMEEKDNNHVNRECKVPISSRKKINKRQGKENERTVGQWVCALPECTGEPVG